MRMLPRLFAIILTFAIFVMPFADGHAAPACYQIFAGKESAADKVYVLKTPRTARAQQELETSIAAIETSGELIRFLNELNHAYPQSLHRSWGPALQNINLAKVLARLQETNLSESDSAELQKTLRKLNQNSEKSLAVNASLGGWTYPLLLMLKPLNTFDFVGRIKSFSSPEHRSFQDLAEGTEFLSFVNPSLHYVLSHLSVPLRKQVLEKIRAEMSGIDLVKETLAMKDGELQQPQSRVYRRNLEVILRMAMAPELDTLKKDLKNTKKNPLDSLDKYYKSLYEYVGPKRGGYPSKVVFETAQILQRRFAIHLQGGNRYIDMYGSFANGKAAFATSDVDMKISEKMFLEIFGHSYREVKGHVFQLYLADYIKSLGDQVSPELKLFWEDYQKAEANLSQKILKRPIRQESEMLAMLYPPVPFKDDPGDSRWYNPVTLRIYAGKIEIHVSDLMSPSEMKVIREIQ